MSEWQPVKKTIVIPLHIYERILQSWTDEITQRNDTIPFSNTVVRLIEGGLEHEQVNKSQY